MAVVVQCFHCNAVLELDDGFRGGVCRCGSCGTLLQVPKGEKEAGAPARKRRPAGPPAAGGGDSAKNNSAAEAESAGPSSSTLRRIQQSRPVAHAPARRSESPREAQRERAAPAERPRVEAAPVEVETEPAPVRPSGGGGARKQLWIIGVVLLLMIAAAVVFVMSR